MKDTLLCNSVAYLPLHSFTITGPDLVDDFFLNKI